MDELEFENPRTDEGLGFTQIRCGAHTQQLAIEDAFKKENKSRVIELARSVMIKLRTPNVSALLKALRLPSPILNCPTRWNPYIDLNIYFFFALTFVPRCSHRWCSKVDLLICLNNYQQFCEDNAETFPELELTLGDFYAAWLKCKMDTEKIGSTFAMAIVNAMKNREKLLLKSDVFVSAICLDARY